MIPAISAAPAAAASPLDRNSLTRRDARIAIIGAGAAGLVAAHTLKRLGYRNVTVFERSADVGGKVRTFVHEGRPYELGAIWFDKPYETVRSLMEELGIHGERGELPDIVEDGRACALLRYPRQKFGTLSFAASVIKFLLLSEGRYAGIWAPGFAQVHPELHLDFDRLARLHDDAHRRKIAPVIDVLRPFLVGCGYGYFEEVPAMYYMKLAPWVVQRSSQAAITGEPIVHRMTRGWQDMWRVLAGELPDVRLDTPVTRVERPADDQGAILITAGGETERFDRLLVTPNPDDASRFLDLSPAEQRLFAKVRYVRLAVTLMTGAGLPHAFLKDHAHPGSRGHVVAIGRNFADRDVYTLYQNLPPDMTTGQAMDLLRRDVARLGGRVDAVLAHEAWSYFPHVSTADADAGFYRELESLQGSQGTYYINSLASFEDVEHAVAYAKNLILERFIPA